MSDILRVHIPERRSASWALISWLAFGVIGPVVLLAAALAGCCLLAFSSEGPPNSAESPLLPTATFVLAALVAAWIYRRWFGSQKVYAVGEKTSFEQASPGFNALRARHFPGPFPNGWYQLLSSEQLVAGAAPLPVTALGQELVAFRGASGQAGVLAAHCPHLGAHLGVGGRVVGDCVECPFHQWRFDASGQCRGIPYIDGPVPASARTRSYPVRELLGCVFLWHDAEGRAPMWEPTVPGRLQDGSMYLGGVTPLRFSMHVSEMFENSADQRHFNTLHAPFPLFPLSLFLNLDHTIQLDWPTGRPDGSHLCLFRESATVQFRGLFPVAPTQRTDILFDGPSIMHFMMHTPLGRFHVMKTALPVAPFVLLTEDRWWADHHMPRWLGWLLARIGSNALEQDRTVWEHKIYRAKPMLVKGERSFTLHRQWYRQFYSPSSIQFNTTATADPSSTTAAASTTGAADSLLAW
ncbi:MAG: Rieske 2Fe-2S domain-containing protein [archaeon]|nr:Rieske 2Fe-2S domain-containing protein [archaeon]